MLKDITNEMLEFKEASRHLWNTFLIPKGALASIGLIQTFEVIERELLREMVLRDLGVYQRADEYRKGPMKGLFVRAKEYLTEIPVQFGSVVEGGNVRWSESEAVPVEALINVEFYDFFDWNPYASRDFSYVRAMDAGSGRLCLFESTNVTFNFIQVN